MDFNTLAIECAPMVAPQTLAAIVKTESNFNPLAININKGYRLERQPKNKDEAVATAKWLIANNYNIDMGLGQVNSVNLARTRLSIEGAFDPCKNISAAATILKWNYESASKAVATIAVVVMGMMAMFGKLEWERAFKVILGIAIVFGAASIITLIGGTTSITAI